PDRDPSRAPHGLSLPTPGVTRELRARLRARSEPAVGMVPDGLAREALWSARAKRTKANESTRNHRPVAGLVNRFVWARGRGGLSVAGQWPGGGSGSRTREDDGRSGSFAGTVDRVGLVHSRRAETLRGRSAGKIDDAAHHRGIDAVPPRLHR